MKKNVMLVAGCLSLVAATFAAATVTVPVMAAPLYPNSVVSNDHEFIATSDQSVFACLVSEGRRTAEMPDKRTDSLMARKTFIFTAHYTDGTSVGLSAHPKFTSEEKALKSVAPAAEAVGKLPTFMRVKLDHVVIHRGR